MASVPQKMGPWPRGLVLENFSAAPYDLEPNQFRFSQNLDVGDTGSLLARKGCRKCGTAGMYTDLSTSGKFWLLGSVDISDGTKYAVIATHNGASPGTTTLYYTKRPHDNSGTGYFTVPGGTLAGIYKTAFQYNNKIYIVPAPSLGGTGQSRTAIDSGVYTAVGTIPSGEISVVVRERAFVVDKTANRISWSKATDPTIWAAPDGGFVDVNPGDGQTINAVVVVNSQLYIFKRNKTFLFTFTSDPALDGQLTLISGLLGAYSATPYTGGGIFLVNDRSVYRLSNNIFTDMAQAQDLRKFMSIDYQPNAVVSLENETLVIGPAFAGSFIFSHAALNLHTGAWSLRSYQKADGSFISGAAPSTKQIQWRDTDTSLAMGGAGVMYGDGTRVLSFTRTAYAFSDDALDVDDSGNTVSPQYVLMTHPYTAGEYDVWKRMHSVYAHLSNTLTGGDNTVTLEVRPSPALTASQTANVPTAGGKVPIRAFRFRGCALTINKPIKNLTTLDPNTTGTLAVWAFYNHISSHRRAVNTS